MKLLYSIHMIVLGQNKTSFYLQRPAAGQNIVAFPEKLHSDGQKLMNMINRLTCSISVTPAEPAAKILHITGLV